MPPIVRVVVLALVSAGFVLLPASAVTAATGAVPAERCAESFLPVSLGLGRPVDQKVRVRLCLPEGARPTTVQLLVHGCLYNGKYWDFPDAKGGTDRYSYVANALKAGYATLDFDMVGTGASSHPRSTQLTVSSGVWVIHQLVQALRAGKISGPAETRPAFAKVIEVSHSFGTFFSWLEVSRYKDVDAAIFTGATHHLNFGSSFIRAVTSFRPAFTQPRFKGLDLGYLAMAPGAQKILYEPSEIDPDVFAHDEANKDVLTVTEFAAFPGVLLTQLDIRVPVFVVLGGKDPMFCSKPLATDCTSAETVVAQERRILGRNVPRLDAYLLPGAGHDLNLVPNATDWFTAANAWATQTVPPR
jgi:pimeloyl-ACP methyl ester carboxylesterase